MQYRQILAETRWRLPPLPGTVPIPDGHVRLYHQTQANKLGSIKHRGLQLNYAKGYEGPKAIYADEQGFYGKPDEKPTVEFHVSRDRWKPPFVIGDVEPREIIAIHQPWHQTARYIETDPKLIDEILAGEHDKLLTDRHYSKAIRFTKHKYQRK